VTAAAARGEIHMFGRLDLERHVASRQFERDVGADLAVIASWFKNRGDGRNKRANNY
jgi:hypothetical protein